ncbi:MAG: DNA methyltransferase [Albidovulum sp.]|nr:DNA methyltransferase [Albidovulum sp.]
MPSNWANRTIWTGDNLPIMRGMNSESVDLIYLDPPFNSNANYAAPIGSEAAGAEFKDTWTLTDVDVEWINLIEAKHPSLHRVLLAAMTDSDKSYLAYMAVRLLEMQRVLKPTGSIYLHCDPTMSHYLKLTMDAIFGRKAFRNEVVWCYKGGGKGTSDFGRKHDIIFRYAAGNTLTFNSNDIRIPYEGQGRGRTDASRWGSRRIGNDLVPYTPHEKGKIPEDWWPFPQLNSNAPERMGYPTQKPLKLLARIIQASSNISDVVFDPFCGCATTLVSANDLNRQWVGIDISEKAAELVRIRIYDMQGLLGDVVHRRDIPKRTDLGGLPFYRDHKKTLYGEQGGDCGGCGTHFKLQNLTVDHIIPKSKGGTDHIENLQLLCGHCNSVKGDRGMEYLKAKLQIRS